MGGGVPEAGVSQGSKDEPTLETVRKKVRGGAPIVVPVTSGRYLRIDVTLQKGHLDRRRRFVDTRNPTPRKWRRVHKLIEDARPWRYDHLIRPLQGRAHLGRETVLSVYFELLCVPLLVFVLGRSPSRGTILSFTSSLSLRSPTDSHSLLRTEISPPAPRNHLCRRLLPPEVRLPCRSCLGARPLRRVRPPCRSVLRSHRRRPSFCPVYRFLRRSSSLAGQPTHDSFDLQWDPNFLNSHPRVTGLSSKTESRGHGSCRGSLKRLIYFFFFEDTHPSLVHSCDPSLPVRGGPWVRRVLSPMVVNINWVHKNLLPALLFLPNPFTPTGYRVYPPVTEDTLLVTLSAVEFSPPGSSGCPFCRYIYTNRNVKGLNKLIPWNNLMSSK